MPGGDRTGPLGAGPRTGRGLGYCSGNPYPGWVYGPGRGWGFGRGRGWGRGFWGRGRWWWYGPYYPAPYSVPYDEKTEKQALEAEANFLKNRLKELEQRLAELSQK